MNIAILGATGSCGRQVAAQLLERALLPETATLHLIGHEGGAHQSELWGLRADLQDAFADKAPKVVIGTDVATSGADLVVMMAGATVTRETKDRAALAEINRKIFEAAASAVGQMPNPVTVVVQSNPIELAVQAFTQWLPRQRVIGAAAWSDSLRFRRELARDLGLRRPAVSAQMWGQHGDHLVPIWSRISARGVSDQMLADVVGVAREGRKLAQLPEEIRAARSEMLKLVYAEDVAGAYEFIEGHPPDIRAAVKPFFTHFTAGRTTELATAHAVVDVVEFLAHGHQVVIPAQIVLAGEMGGLTGPLAVPVVADTMGWSMAINEEIENDERSALLAASCAVNESL